MKQLYKCDYCSFIGTAKEVKTHEVKCEKNYKMKTCKYKEAKFVRMGFRGFCIKSICTHKDNCLGLCTEYYCPLLDANKE